MFIYKMRYEGEPQLFSQEQVNSINAEFKRRVKDAETTAAELKTIVETHKAELAELRTSMTAISTDRQTMVDQLEELGTTAKLTAEEKSKLQIQIEEERKVGLSESERMQKEVEKLTIESQSYRKDSENKYAKLLNLNRSSLFKAEVTSAATRKEQEAHNPDHIVAILSSHLTWEDEKPVIKDFRVNEDTTGDYSPAEAVKHMATMEEHKPLFKPTGKTGLNGKSDDGDHTPPGDLDLGKMSMKEYTENKEALIAQYEKEKVNG